MQADNVAAPEIQVVCTVGRAAGMHEYRLFDRHDRVVLVGLGPRGGSPRQCSAATSTRSRPLREAEAVGGR